MKKKIIIFTDISTAILLMIQLQSMIVMFFEEIEHIFIYEWIDYLELYRLYGITDVIMDSKFGKLYVWFIFIVFCLNIFTIVSKLIDLKKKEIVKGIYKSFIIFNILYVVLKTYGFFVIYTALMSV